MAELGAASLHCLQPSHPNSNQTGGDGHVCTMPDTNHGHMTPRGVHVAPPSFRSTDLGPNNCKQHRLHTTYSIHVHAWLLPAVTSVDCQLFDCSRPCLHRTTCSTTSLPGWPQVCTATPTPSPVLCGLQVPCTFCCLHLMARPGGRPGGILSQRLTQHAAKVVLQHAVCSCVVFCRHCLQHCVCTSSINHTETALSCGAPASL